MNNAITVKPKFRTLVNELSKIYMVWDKVDYVKARKKAIDELEWTYNEHNIQVREQNDQQEEGAKNDVKTLRVGSLAQGEDEKTKEKNHRRIPPTWLDGEQ